MHIWLLDLHPITAPIANELSYAVVHLVKTVTHVYCGVLVPVVSDVVFFVKYV